MAAPAIIIKHVGSIDWKEASHDNIDAPEDLSTDENDAKHRSPLLSGYQKR